MAKYNAKPTTVDGRRFDSQAEARRYQQLTMLQQAGAIDALECHPRYTVWEGVDGAGKRQKITYEGDFRYTEGGCVVVEDVKGVKTPVFNLKAKMFRCRYPEIDFRIIEGV